MKNSTNFSMIIFFVIIFVGNVTIAMDGQHSSALEYLQCQIQEANKSALNAIQCNSSKQLETAINNGANLNFIDEDGNNWLLIAIQKDRREILNLLLNEPMFHASEFINHQNNYGESPLSKACFLGNLFVVKNLTILRNIKINQQDANGYTAAHYAAQSDCFINRAKIIEQLADYGADFTIPDKTGITPVIFLAPHYQDLHADVFQKIMKQRDIRENTQLHLLAKAKPNALQNKTDYDLFAQVTGMLNTVGLGVFNLNLYGELAVDLAVQKHEELKSSSASHHDITACEYKLHQLLRFYLTQAHTSPIVTTSCFTHKLNIETEIALDDSINDKYYYDRSIEYRNKTKALIQKKPRILTWFFASNYRQTQS